MKTITIEGSLTESKLITALQALLAPRSVTIQHKLPDSRYLWDGAFTHNHRLVLVEYDGDEHYRNSLKIKSDIIKTNEAINLGCQVVRIPYWVQLDTVTLKYYLDLSAKVVQDFPHGFITTQYFPASFCELGVVRFKREFESLPAEIRQAVVNSIRERIGEHGFNYVMPKSLRRLVAA
jgi:hypothetical protein